MSSGIYKRTKEACEKISKRMIGKKYALGYKHTRVTRRKMSEARLGKSFTKKHKENISKARIGYKPTKEALVNMSKAQIGHKHTQATRKKMSNSHFGMKSIKHSIRMSGRYNPMFGKKTSRYFKRGYYHGVYMRSSYEVKFAKWLDKRNIRWKYEYKTFDLKNYTYTPDFYLPKYNLFIEIKGWASKKFKHKYCLLKQMYPKIKIKIFGSKTLKKANII